MSQRNHHAPAAGPGTVDLSTPLSWRAAFRFPLQSAASRRDVMIGGLLLLLPLVGWLLNMGHRIALVHAMQQGRPPWPAWRSWPTLLKHGLITWLGMIYYYTPGLALLLWAAFLGNSLLMAAGALLLVLATLAIPGYMTHYCKRFDPAEIFNPCKALRRSIEAGPRYWHAWRIALVALCLSFLGLLALGVGFLFTSVWFWQVAGYSFSNAFTTHYALLAKTDARVPGTPSPDTPGGDA